MSNKSVGIRDVAAAAGVSVTTVSHVLNNTVYARVGAETRERVREAAQRLGYGPNRMAQALRTQRSGMLGFISEEIATTPHAGRIILGAEETARRRGYNLMIINTSSTATYESRTADIAALLERQVDGVLYATMYHRQIAVPDNLNVIPAILVDSEDTNHSISSVIPDETGGATAAVRTLIEAGHQRIGMINNTDDVPATHSRLRAFKDTLSDAGLTFHADLVEAEPSEVPGGYQAALRLLARKDRPTAVFCYNDRMAMGAYRAATELGLKIPRDLSVVGFDNQELIAENLYPALTTVSLPHYEMGAWATENLIDAIEGKTDLGLFAVHPTLLACPLVIRNSVAPPAS
ncbi:LacI family DNA-binding transcriptional regulator [Arthrobacter sp. MMS18-M83]|uniref:LacI family DNA-binding transcriptional regulator n=1 Tax=Arthrobacter sp. MMS18-M83 TaxID=2996261 RepID=UPI00227BBCED|nr:LacI family DNA-binding transcriptional regulator [Arthrobacter sp. MMS18-M83]WAH99186.1 LacI family DNA-binding transcriptional regulator [Arthrobacter sp. MMS18-M83]